MSEVASVLRRAAGNQGLREEEACGGPALEPAGGEVQAGLRVARRGRLGDRAAGLDLVVDDLLDEFLAAEERPAGLEVQVTLDRPLEPGREPELDSSLHCDRLTEPRHELLEGDQRAP